jgi:hypothetical protein
VFFTPECPDGLCGPPSFLFNEYRGSFSGRGGGGVKRPGRKTHHSPPSIARLRISGAITPRPHMPSWHAQGQIYPYFFVA